MIVFSPSLVALAATGATFGPPVRRWVELTTADATGVTFQNIGNATVYLKGTVGSIAPINADGVLEFPPASQAITYLLSDMFPGISGVNRLWAYADAETFVTISHAPSTNRTVAVGPSPGAEDLNAPIFGYHNLVGVADIAASSAASGYPASNLSNPSTAALWRASSTAAQTLSAVISPAQQIDYIGIAAHNFGSARIALSVETQAGLGDPWVEVIAPFMATNDNALIFRFDNQIAYGARVILAAGEIPAQAGVMYVGKLLVSKQRAYVGHAPMTLDPITEIVNGRSERGNFLGRTVIGEYLTGSLSLADLKPDWVRAYFVPFIRSAKESPFFFAWRPLRYPDETAFCALMNDPKPTNDRSNGMMRVDLEFEGVAP
jgi:hypothetical protein